MSDTLKAGFAALPLEAQASLLPELHALHDGAKQAKVAELQAQLEALGVTSKPVRQKAEGGTRASPAPKYRSLKNPAMTWAARGQQPNWLKAEMAETGKPLEAFLISAQDAEEKPKGKK